MTFPGNRLKYDYELLEREYVTGSMSLRELTRTHEIPTFSSVAVQAKKRNWDKKRTDFQELAKSKELQVIANERANRIEEMYDDILRVIHRGIFRFLELMDPHDVQLSDGTVTKVPGIVVDAADLAKLIDRFQLLRGQPTKREAHLGLNIDLSDPNSLPSGLLRELQVAAREAGAGSPSVGSSPLPLVTGPRQVN